MINICYFAAYLVWKSVALLQEMVMCPLLFEACMLFFCFSVGCFLDVCVCSKQSLK